MRDQRMTRSRRQITTNHSAAMIWRHKDVVRECVTVHIWEMTPEYTHSGIVGKARIFYKYSFRRRETVPIVPNIETAGLDRRNGILYAGLGGKT